MASSDSKIAKIQTHFQALSSVASSLNTASDELTKVVAILDEALNKLNIGVTVWVTFRSRNTEDAEYDDDQVGYCKVSGKWGFALRRIWGDHYNDNHYDDGPWLFNDASREMRLGAVDKIPEVIEELGKEASDTAKRVQEKTKEVREFAEAITKMANGEKKLVAPPPPPPAPLVAPPPPPPVPKNATVQRPPVPPNATPQRIPAPPLPPSVQNVVIGKEGVK